MGELKQLLWDLSNQLESYTPDNLRTAIQDLCQHDDLNPLPEDDPNYDSCGCRYEKQGYAGQGGKRVQTCMTHLNMEKQIQSLTQSLADKDRALERIESAWQNRAPYDDESGVIELALQFAVEITKELESLRERGWI